MAVGYIQGLTKLRDYSSSDIVLAGFGHVPATRAFKSGNSQAVRIPAEIAYDDPGAELTITRLGDVITIYPARTSLARAVEGLRRLPKPKMREEREAVELPERGRD